MLVGCASSPDKISTAYVSPMQYAHYDCDQIALEQMAIERKSNELYHNLKQKSRGDAWQMGVGLVLFWPALFALEGGDGPEAAEYSRLKGEYEALRIVSVQKKCELQFHEDLKESITDENASSASVNASEGEDGQAADEKATMAPIPD